MLKGPSFAGATWIWNSDYIRHRSAIDSGLGNDKEKLFEVRGDVGLATPDAALEKRYRQLLEGLGIEYETGQSTSYDEWVKTGK